jgi:hypothetical protein
MTGRLHPPGILSSYESTVIWYRKIEMAFISVGYGGRNFNHIRAIPAASKGISPYWNKNRNDQKGAKQQ